MTGSDRRREILDMATDCVCKDRQRDYGDAEDNFTDIAAVVTVLLSHKLKEPLTSIDVATFNLAQKLCRAKNSPGVLDHWTDIVGYGACGGGIALRGSHEGKDSGAMVAHRVETVEGVGPVQPGHPDHPGTSKR